MKNPHDKLTNELPLNPPQMSFLFFNPGVHFSFPAIRCACGYPLDEHDYCTKCEKYVFDN